MAKIRPKESQTPSDNSTPKLENPGKQHKKKRKVYHFLKKKVKKVEEKMQKDSKPPAELPPKTPQEISANWKALQELLRQNAAILNSTVPNTSSKKRNGTRAEGMVSQVNRTGTVLTSKPGEKAQKILTQHGQTKSENNINRNHMPLAQGSRRERKGGRQRASDEKELRAVKQKWRKTEEPGEAQPADIWFDDVDPDDIEAALGPEAAKVARKNLGIQEKRPEQLSGQVLEKERAFEGLTKAVAMDCEMVGVGPAGEESIVARVSIVNLFGKCIYDKYIKPTEKVTDYRTAISGIQPEHLKAGEDFKVVQKEVAIILKGRILVGHALHNDLKILFLDHPKKKTRDTQRYKPFKQQVKSGRPSLKLLCEKLLNVRVQTSGHSSIEDAQAAMRLYTMVKKDWEASLKENSKAKKE